METFVVPGTVESLGPIREFVRSKAAEAGLDKKRTYRLQLAVDEIAANIALHGYEEQGLAGDIEVQAEVGPDRLTITLVDSAIPYDPFSRVMPSDLDAPLQDRAIGGLGVFLAINNVNEFLYRFNDGQNHNIFVVQRESESTAT
ncbi:MAG TPA: anti-sigma regulatory factor [Anaerolineae bacterium]|nr:anti-sigma regulatory factor [Anaerolineae bacterium]